MVGPDGPSIHQGSRLVQPSADHSLQDSAAVSLLCLVPLPYAPEGCSVSCYTWVQDKHDFTYDVEQWVCCMHMDIHLSPHHSGKDHLLTTELPWALGHKGLVLYSVYSNDLHVCPHTGFSVPIPASEKYRPSVWCPFSSSHVGSLYFLTDFQINLSVLTQKLGQGFCW